MANKTMEQFYTDFLEEIQMSVDADLSGWNIEDFFTSIMLEYLEEAGEADDYIMCPFRGYGLQLNAYSLTEDYENLTIYVSIYNDSLKAKPFVILAGTSGTGKTRLVRLFSEAIGAKYKLVSVRPDWSDSSDLFGHVNLKGEFVPGAIIKYIHEAAEPENLNTPYFLCLDEMNLARVEYYLSDFLSIIETRHRENGHVVTDEIILDKDAKDIYGKLILPENLYVIGTVNMDETTFPFSKKVLDRANTIEFSYVGLVPDFSEIPEVVEAQTCGNNLLKTEYITLMSDVDEEDRQFVTDICVELQEINKILQSAQAHVGYRVRDEIVFYMLNNKKAELLDKDLAFDNEIMQKILPRIQGRDIASRVHTTYGSQIEVFENVIPMSVKAAETSAEGKSIYMHCPKGKVAEAYKNLTQEVLKNEK